MDKNSIAIAGRSTLMGLVKMIGYVEEKRTWTLHFCDAYGGGVSSSQVPLTGRRELLR